MISEADMQEAKNRQERQEKRNIKMKCEFKFNGCMKEAIGIYPDVKSMNWLVGDIPVCDNCRKSLIYKELKEIK